MAHTLPVVCIAGTHHVAIAGRYVLAPETAAAAGAITLGVGGAVFVADAGESTQVLGNFGHQVAAGDGLLILRW